MKRTSFRAAFGKPKLLPWNIQGSGRTGVWSRVASRIVRRPGLTLTIGLVVFGGLGLGALGYAAGGFGGNTSPPSGSDSAAGTSLLAKHFPQSSANPTSLLFQFDTPAWENPAPLATATDQLRASSLFTQVIGPLNPTGAELTPSEYTALHAELGPAKDYPSSRPGHHRSDPAVRDLPSDRELREPGRKDGPVLDRAEGRRSGKYAGAQRGSRDPDETTRVAKSIGAADSAVGGEAPAIYDISAISNSDLKRVIPIAILAIGILLAIVLRSLVAPLYLIASVALPSSLRSDSPSCSSSKSAETRAWSSSCHS